jgi:hypothetical protein
VNFAFNFKHIKKSGVLFFSALSFHLLYIRILKGSEKCQTPFIVAHFGFSFNNKIENVKNFLEKNKDFYESYTAAVIYFNISSHKFILDFILLRFCLNIFSFSLQLF